MAKAQKNDQQNRPPIVAVLGHVDHGKTSLLDYIRKTNVVAREHGGITQSIGAYQVQYKADKKDSTVYPITFIDTPGHEAFAKMRSRGAAVADIAILVVAANDSVKPQTIESIRMIKDAGVRLIVAANKVDLPDIHLDKVKQDLARYGVQVEGFGGDVPFVPISAKAGTGVSNLLEMIILVASDIGLPSHPNEPLSAPVIETRIDKGKGLVATVIVKAGILQFGMILFDGAQSIGKVRAMFDEFGHPVKLAVPGTPVEVLGFTQLPTIGTPLVDRAQVVQIDALAQEKKVFSLADLLQNPVDQTKRLRIVLKADTAGSLEAITEQLGTQVDIIMTGVGDILESDILLAKSTKAFVVGFNVKAPNSIERLAQLEKVVFRVYTIIYELLDELHDVVEGMAELTTGERDLGIGSIIAEFPFDGNRVAGTKILTGRIARGDQVKIMRGETEFARAKVKSVRKGKDDATKVEAGNDCGVLFDREIAFELGDGIIAFTTV